MIRKTLIFGILLLPVPALAWNLLTTTYGGQVSLVKNIETRALCEDAASIAKTGRTVAGEAKYWKDLADAQSAIYASWRKTHGCLAREPRDKFLNVGGITMMASVEYAKTPRGYWCPVPVGGAVIGNVIAPGDVAKAECFE